MKKQEKERIELYKEEKSGIYSVLIMFMIAWGSIVLPYLNPLFRWFGLIGWIALGIIGFSLWRIIEGLLERSNTKEVKKDVK